MKELRRFFTHPWRYIFTRTLLFFFYYPCRGQVLSEETIEVCKENGFIMVANHVSYLDAIVLDAYLQYKHNLDVLYLVKEKLFRHWLWGTIVSSKFCVMISNESDKIVSFDDFQRLKASRHIVLFPEGTRSRSGELGPFKPGATKFAQRFGLPLLPVALKGFYETWPPSAKLPWPKRCAIVVGSPYTIRGGEDLNMATDQLRLTIEEMLTT